MTPLEQDFKIPNCSCAAAQWPTIKECSCSAAALTGDTLVMSERQQGHPGLAQVRVALLILVIKHVELQGLQLQVLVQVCVHGHRVGHVVVEPRLAAFSHDTGVVVGEVEEFIDHVGAGLLWAPGREVAAALDGDTEFIVAAVRRGRLRREACG